MPLLINSLITQKTPQKMWRRERPLLCLISFLLVLNPFFLFSSIFPCIFPSLLEVFIPFSFIPLLAYLFPFSTSMFHSSPLFLLHLLLYHLFYCFLHFLLFPVVYTLLRSVQLPFSFLLNFLPFPSLLSLDLHVSS